MKQSLIVLNPLISNFIKCKIVIVQLIYNHYQIRFKNCFKRLLSLDYPRRRHCAKVSSVSSLLEDTKNKDRRRRCDIGKARQCIRWTLSSQLPEDMIAASKVRKSQTSLQNAQPYQSSSDLRYSSFHMGQSQFKGCHWGMLISKYFWAFLSMGKVGAVA